MSASIPATFAPVAKESTRDRVCAAIREAIACGRLRVGQRLTEALLTRELQVSRSVIREALHLLASEGIIELSTHRGATVVDLDASQVDQIVQVRLLLEPEAVRLAMTRMTAKDRDAVRRAAQAVERARGDTPAFVPLDHSFHRLVWSLSGNAVLAKHLALLTAPLFSLGIILRNPRAVAKAQLGAPANHITLARTICDGPTEAAMEAIRNHITHNWQPVRTAAGILHESVARGAVRPKPPSAG